MLFFTYMFVTDPTSAIDRIEEQPPQRQLQGRKMVIGHEIRTDLVEGFAPVMAKG
jgi:hypothetical protein